MWFKENLNGKGKSVFVQYYEQLVEMKVKFPDKINYFKVALINMQQGKDS